MEVYRAYINISLLSEKVPFSQNMLLQMEPFLRVFYTINIISITHYQESIYVNNYFELAILVSSAFKIKFVDCQAT